MTEELSTGPHSRASNAHQAPSTPSAPPRTFHVVGNSGSGKTTLARAIASRLGIPHLELDAVFWDAGWAFRDLAEAHQHLKAFLAGPGAQGWSIDGNWTSRIDGLLDGADVVVWLDYPRHTVIRRVLRRTVGRGLFRRELWHGNREHLANLLRWDPEENIVRYAWTQHERYRERYAAVAAKDPRVVRLATPRAAQRWLESLR